MNHSERVTEDKIVSVAESLEFKEYFLRSRLKRVPISVLMPFVANLAKSEQEEGLKKASQAELIDKILFYCEIRQHDEDFANEFSKFIRDHLFSAKESVYLIQVPNQDAVISWINTWKDEKYLGHRYNFSLHTSILLKERSLLLDGQKVFFPSNVILLVASSKKPKQLPSGLDLIMYFPTVEIELIFRKGMPLMEARGDVDVIRDFMNTAVLDSHNPLSMASSIFVGDREDAKGNSLTKSLSKIVKIDELRKSLKGKYLSISAPVKGEKTSRIQASFEELDDLNEETHPTIKPMLTTLIQDQDRSRISFVYDEKKFSFGITIKGGLTFTQYAPEEVVTYIVSKLMS